MTNYLLNVYHINRYLTDEVWNINEVVNGIYNHIDTWTFRFNLDEFWNKHNEYNKIIFFIH